MNDRSGVRRCEVMRVETNTFPQSFPSRWWVDEWETPMKPQRKKYNKIKWCIAVSWGRNFYLHCSRFIRALSFGEKKINHKFFMKQFIYEGTNWIIFRWNTVDKSLHVSEFIVDGLNLCHSIYHVKSSHPFGILILNAAAMNWIWIELKILIEPV